MPPTPYEKAKSGWPSAWLTWILKAAVDGQKAVAQPSLDTNKNEGRRQWSRKDLNTI